MPYIKQDRRNELDSAIENLADLVKRTDQRAGDLNYTITSLLKQVFGEMRYADHNEAIGVLECIKLEFYRRRTAPYEDIKIVQNGDV